MFVSTTLKRRENTYRSKTREEMTSKAVKDAEIKLFFSGAVRIQLDKCSLI